MYGSMDRRTYRSDINDVISDAAVQFSVNFASKSALYTHRSINTRDKGMRLLKDTFNDACDDETCREGGEFARSMAKKNKADTGY